MFLNILSKVIISIITAVFVATVLVGVAYQYVIVIEWARRGFQSVVKIFG